MGIDHSNRRANQMEFRIALALTKDCIGSGVGSRTGNRRTGNTGSKPQRGRCRSVEYHHGVLGATVTQSPEKHGEPAFLSVGFTSFTGCHLKPHSRGDRRSA